MLYSEINDLQRIFKEIEQENKEEFVYILRSFIEAFIKSAVTFGITHKVTIDSINLFNEFKNILKEEKNIHDFIINKGKEIDVAECMRLINKLQVLNEDTVIYYDKAFENIVDSCETKCVDRATRSKKNFDTLIETEEYRNILTGLTLTLNDVKKYLNYEEEFWSYIDDKTIIVDGKTEMDNCGLIKDENIIKIFVPRIVNKETANINRKIFKEAYTFAKEKKLIKNFK